MDKNVKSFVVTSVCFIFLLITVLVAFGYVYRYSTINTYNNFLIIMMLLTIIITSVFILSVVSVFFTYHKGYVSKVLVIPVKFGLNFTMPFMLFASGFLKGNKDMLRNVYISVNNILVQSLERKYHAKDILLLLPHCLQNSECTYKITNDIKNCIMCGKCCIRDIIKAGMEFGVEVVVVTGGTAARNIIETKRPKLIVSVACERDLTSGISDVAQIPVIGIVNKRPCGPCFNTDVDVMEIRKILNRVIVK